MNKVELTGRLTADPEVRYLNGANGNNMAYATFTLAVNRKYVKKDDPNAQKADFIRCMSYGKTAEFVEQYFKKGQKADISGRIQTGKYTNKEGVTVYTTDVVIEDIEFGESKSSSGGSGVNTNTSKTDSGFSGGYQNGNGYSGGNQNNEQPYMNIPEGVNEELPFS